MKMSQLRFYTYYLSVLSVCFLIGFSKPIAPIFTVSNSLLFCMGIGWIGWTITRPTFPKLKKFWQKNSQNYYKRFVEGATPESLGAIRIIACISLIIITLWYEDIPRSALFPIEMLQPMGLLQFLYAIPGFEVFVRSEWALQIFEWLTVLILFLGMIGWQTRIMIPLGGFCYCILGGIVRQYLGSYHTGLIVVYILAVLSLAPCGDGLSVDRLLKVHQGQPVPKADYPLPIYGWARYSCWVIPVLCYLASAMSKLRNGGFFWWNPVNLKGIMYGCTLSTCNNIFHWDLSLRLGPHLPDFVFALFGLVALLGEIAFVSVLFSKVARRFLPILMMSMHLGIWAFLNIVFIDFILLQLIFYDFTAIGQSIIRRIAPKRKKLSQSNSQSVGQNLKARASIIVPVSKQTLGTVRYPIIIVVLTLIVGFCWVNRIEYYPFTGFYLFADKDTSGVVLYNTMYAHYESGRTARIYPEEIIAAQRSAPLWHTDRCFSKDPSEVHICDAYLSALGSIHNQSAPANEKFTYLELQRWQRNFLLNPLDPNYENLIERHTFKLDPAANNL
jgi:hypothetical protein